MDGAFVETEDGSSSPPFCSGLDQDTVIKGRRFHACEGREMPPCAFLDEKAAGYHESCLDFDPQLATGSLSVFFRRATEYAFEPPPSVQERRRVFLRQNLADGIHSAYPLPLELCEYIAKHLVRECAVVLLGLLSPSSNSSYSISTFYNIYATFIAIEGTRYINSLSNTKDSAEAQLVWTSSGAKDIFVAEDHWGLRSLLPARGGETPAVGKAGAWWRRLSSPSSLRVNTDVKSPSPAPSAVTN